MKMTPVLLVQSVEMSLPFWVDRLGWEKTVEVPEGDRLGFVILVRGNVELMLQTFESARRDEPRLIGDPQSHRASLFVEVDDWAEILHRLSGYEVAMPERQTFYGMRELGVLDPDGHIVVFAKRLGEGSARE